MSTARRIGAVLKFSYAFQGGPRDGWSGVADCLMDEVATPEGDVYRLGVETAIGTRCMKGGVWIYGHVGRLPEARNNEARMTNDKGGCGRA